MLSPLITKILRIILFTLCSLLSVGNWCTPRCLRILWWWPPKFSTHIGTPSLTLPNAIQKTFLDIQKSSSVVRFRWYFLLCHILLYGGSKVHPCPCGPKLNLRNVDEQNQRLPIQEWMYIWDMHCDRSNYVMFEGLFVKVVLQNLGSPINWRLSDKMRFLRPLELDPTRNLP